MQSRFAIVFMSVAGAGLLFCAGLLFGLGVMSSPKGGHHKEIAVTNEPVKVARQETTGSGDPSRPLTPLTPVHPGTSEPAQTATAPQPAPAAPAAQAAAQAAPSPAAVTPAPTAQAAQTASPAPTQATSAAAEPQKAADAAPQQAKLTPPPAPATIAAAERPAVTPANATPVALHARNSCDVDACARAYKSFRESDCTYQPYSGPRQLCVSPPAPAREASRGDDRTTTVHVHRGARDVEVQNVQREGARATDDASSRDEGDGPAMRRAYSRDLTADGEDDGIDDSRVIVRRSDDGRGYDDRGGWHRSFFAPVEDDDDDQ